MVINLVCIRYCNLKVKTKIYRLIPKPEVKKELYCKDMDRKQKH